MRNEFMQTLEPRQMMAVDAGGRPDAPVDLGTVRAATRKFNATVGGSADRWDAMTFHVKSASSFRLRLDKLQANADVFLVDFSKTPETGTVAVGTRGGTKAEKINATLQAGDYGLLIGGKSRKTKYRLQLSARPLADSGNASSTGQLASTLTGPITWKESQSVFGIYSPLAYWHFNPDGTGNKTAATTYVAIPREEFKWSIAGNVLTVTFVSWKTGYLPGKPQTYLLQTNADGTLSANFAGMQTTWKAEA